VLGEAVGIIAVLALTSGLTATEPAKTAYHPRTTAELVTEKATLQVAAVPRGDRRVDLHLYVFDPSGQPADPPEVTASVSHGRIGPLPVRLEAVASGQRLGRIDVPVAGTWELATFTSMPYETPASSRRPSGAPAPGPPRYRRPSPTTG
jgi:hypothetical protein